MSFTALDTIDRLPLEIAARLETDEYFSDIPVVVAEAGDVNASLQQKTAAITSKGGKRGVGVIVLQIVARDDTPNLELGALTLRPSVRVYEVVELNRDGNGTGKSARQIARKVRDLLKTLRLPGMVNDFVSASPCIEPVIIEDLPNVVAYQVNFETTEADDEVITIVNTPAISEGTDPTPTFVLTCATEGAAIYYTLDDSYPGAGRAGSQLYEGPVAIPETGCTVRACAYKSGCIASTVARAHVTVGY